MAIARKLRNNKLNLYVGSVIVVSAIAQVIAFSQLGDAPFFGAFPMAFMLFCLLLLATEMRPMPMIGDDTVVTASWVFSFALLFIAPWAGALAAVTATALAGDLLTGRPWNKAMFNASQLSLSLAVGGGFGSLVVDLHQVVNGDPVSVQWLAGVTVACVTGFWTNNILIGIVVALHQGLPVGEMVRRSLTVALGMDGLLLALAPIFVVIGIHGLVLVPLLLITVWAIFKSAAIALSNKHEATHDQLTDIPNRRMFEDHAALVIENAANANHLAALIHIDLDGFKGINDRLGHHYGDIVLKEIAKRLTESKRSIDHVARLGGDEFAIMLGQIGSISDAEAIANRALGEIERKLNVEGVPLGVSASLGVAVYPSHGEDVTSLLHHADMAMYTAKTDGTGVETYTAGEQSGMPGRMGLLAELTNAIDTEQLHLVYQPKVNIASGRVTSVEALLRWEHPVHGNVPPSWFMPQAEQTDLMTSLTDHILRMAIAQCAEWRRAGIEVGVAINASARNLHDLRFPRRVGEILAEHEADAKWFEIEITENTVLEDPVRTAAVLAELRELGVGLTIDDFGTGYSSLASLRRLTIDRIKIDRSFITDLANHDGDLTIARSVIELGRNLGLKTVAEGVETPEVYAILKELGCDEIQGFMVSTPVCANDITPMLTKGWVDLDALEAYEHDAIEQSADDLLAVINDGAGDELPAGVDEPHHDRRSTDPVNTDPATTEPAETRAPSPDMSSHTDLHAAATAPNTSSQ